MFQRYFSKHQHLGVAMQFNLTCKWLVTVQSYERPPQGYLRTYYNSEVTMAVTHMVT